MAKRTSSSTGTDSTSLLKKLIPTSPSQSVKLGSLRLTESLVIVRDVHEDLEPEEKDKLLNRWNGLNQTREELKSRLDSGFPTTWKPKTRRQAQDFDRDTKLLLYYATNSSNIAMKRAMEAQTIDTPHWWTKLSPDIQVLGLTGRVKNLRRSGFGGYGEIWKGDWTEGGEIRKVGVKFLNLRLSEDKTRMRLIRELRVWQTVDHAHILQLHGIMWHDSSPVPGLVSPWMENGDLVLYLENRPDTAISERLTLLCQVARGLRYLHEKGLVHCDLKANNVLVDQDGKAYLSDFGLSRWLSGLEPSMGPCFLSSQLTGPRRWMAPEICDSDPPVTKTFATDIYAFGGLMMEVLTGHVPYHLLSDRAVVGALSDGQHPDRPQCDKPCSIGEGGRCVPVCDEHWKYMEECWSTNPESRPNATALVDQLDRFRVAEHL